MGIVRSIEQIGKSLKRRLLPSAASLALIGCSSLPVVPSMAAADWHQDAQSRLMYEILVGELAGRRGMLDEATDSYMRAAQLTTDERVAKRATQLAVWGRRWADAEMVGNRWLSLAPTDPDAHELLAQIYLRTNQTHRATQSFSNFINGSSDGKTAIDEVVLMLMRDADRERSIEIMDELARRHPNEIEIIVAQARIALSIGSRENALEYAERALSIEAQNGSALLIKAQALGAMGKPAEGFAAIAGALQHEPLNVELRLGFAQLLVAAGRYDDAAEQLDKLHEQVGATNPDVLLNIGLLALESKRSDSAARYLQDLLATGQHNDQAHFYLARINDEQQEFAKAIAHYEQVLSENLYFPAQLRAAELHATMGELDLGRQRLQTLSNALGNPSLQPQIIATDARMVQQAGDIELAIKVLSEGLLLYPDSSELLYSRALTADANNDTQMLRKDLTRLIEIEPDNAHAMNALGYHLTDNNIELDRARELLDRAYELEPNDAAIMDSLGWLQFRQGDLESALELLQQAYALLPDPEIAAHLGEVLWVSGDQTAARSLWDKAILDAPDHTKLKQAIERFSQ